MIRLAACSAAAFLALAAILYCWFAQDKPPEIAINDTRSGSLHADDSLGESTAHGASDLMTPSNAAAESRYGVPTLALGGEAVDMNLDLHIVTYGGLGIEGASVTLLTGAQRSAPRLSNSDGLVSGIAYDPRVLASVEVSKAGYRSCLQPVKPTVGNLMFVALVPLDAITGSVVDRAGQPVYGAAVQLLNEARTESLAQASSLRDGRFLLDRSAIRSTRGILLATKEGLGSATADVDVDTLADVQLRIGDSGTMAGVIVSENGRLVGRATLCLIADEIYSKDLPEGDKLRLAVLTNTGDGLLLADADSDDHGRFAFSGLRPHGRYWVFAPNRLSEGGWGPFSVGAQDLHIVIRAFPVHVRVTRSGAPLPRATVRCFMEDGRRLASGLTCVKGEMRFVARDLMALVVEVEAEGLVGRRRIEVTELESGECLQIEVVDKPNASSNK